jgi:hypothetical protein
MVRDFRGVLEREGAQMGLFICLNAPTKAMIAEAAAAGIADTVHGDLPKLQLVSIEEWFKGTLPSLPPLEHLPSAALSTSKRRAHGRAKRPDPKQPEFQYVFPGKTPDAVVHLNPQMVKTAS